MAATAAYGAEKSEYSAAMPSGGSPAKPMFWFSPLNAISPFPYEP